MTSTSQEFCTPAHRKQYLKELETERSYKRFCIAVEEPQRPLRYGGIHHNSDEYNPQDEP